MALITFLSYVPNNQRCGKIFATWWLPTDYLVRGLLTTASSPNPARETI